jgi:tetratricopeptide (TPR) repeat protein
MTTVTSLSEEREAFILFRRAVELYESERLAEALPLFEQSRDLNQAQGNAEGGAIIAMYLGQIHAGLDAFDRASHEFQTAYQAMQVLGDRSGQARALLELAELAAWRGEPAQAKRLLVQALDLLGNKYDADAQAQAHTRLGFLAFDDEAYDQARQHYEQALKLFDQTGDRLGAAGAMIELANILQAEEPERAKRLFEHGRDVAQSVGNDYLASVALHGMGTIYADQGEWPTARRYYQIALELKARIADDAGQAATYLLLGAAEQGIGNLVAARNAWQRALDLAQTHHLTAVAEMAQTELSELAPAA